jgi:hypothetical protein
MNQPFYTEEDNDTLKEELLQAKTENIKLRNQAKRVKQAPTPIMDNHSSSRTSILMDRANYWAIRQKALRKNKMVFTKWAKAVSDCTIK